MDPEFRRGGIDTGFLDRFQGHGPATGDLPPAVVATAAMQFSGALDAADTIDPWSSLRGWRLWGHDPAVEELVIDGRSLSVTVSVLGRDCCRIGEDVVPGPRTARHASDARFRRQDRDRGSRHHWRDRSRLLPGKHPCCAARPARTDRRRGRRRYGRRDGIASPARWLPSTSARAMPSSGATFLSFWKR